MIKIVIAAHKKYRMPDDSMYVPLFVGAEGKTEDFGYTRDDSGDNISTRNPSYCELTGLYWAWKNLDADYIGLVHYRRHFSLKKKSKDPFENIVTEKELDPYIGKIKAFIPKKRNYYIETLYSHYAHTHYAEHLDETRKIIEAQCPEYISVLDEVYAQKKGCMFNMMIMSKDMVDRYCTWLFNILFELENRVDSDSLSAFQKRFYGRVSEILFNVWLKKEVADGNLKDDEIMSLNCIYTENIKWGKKVKAFLAAKFANKKYEGSF